MNQYKHLIAGSDEESEYGDVYDQKDGPDSSHIEAMRKKLLSGLRDEPMRHKDLQGSDDDELEVNFGIGFGEDIGKKLLSNKKDKKDKENMSEFQKW